MKTGIHPKYNEVVFQDISTGDTFLTRSTIKPSNDDTIELDGKKLPLIRIEVSSASHPFYTGQQNLIDTEGRVEKFRQKYGARK